MQLVLEIPISVFCNLSADLFSQRCKAACIASSRSQQGHFGSASFVDYGLLKSSRRLLSKGNRRAGDFWKNHVVLILLTINLKYKALLLGRCDFRNQQVR